MILTSGELLELMEKTPPSEWPNTRGYGYSNDASGQKIKGWHLYVVREFLERLEANGGGR